MDYMSLDIGEALKEGIDRTFTRNGGIIASLFFITTVITSIASQSLFSSIELPEQWIAESMRNGTEMAATNSTEMATPLAMGGPIEVHGLLIGLGAIVSAVISIAAIRTFTSSETETVPSEYFKRNIGWVLLNNIVGGIVFGLAVLTGLIMFIIPGVFLMVSLLFWNIHVAKHDTSFVEAFKESWGMTKGNRFNVFALWLLVGLVSFAVGFAGGLIATPLSLLSPAAAELGNLAVSALTAVFGVATLTQAYNQLRE